MKRSKRIYVLLAVLLVAFIATVGVIKFEEKKEKIKNSDEVILQISSDTVTALSWENETEALSFHKDGAWLYDADEAFPVDEEAMDDLLELFEEFGVSFIIEEVEDFGQYGLDDPVCTIRITTTQPLDGVETAGDSQPLDSTGSTESDTDGESTDMAENSATPETDVAADSAETDAGASDVEADTTSDLTEANGDAEANSDDEQDGESLAEEPISQTADADTSESGSDTAGSGADVADSEEVASNDVESKAADMAEPESVNTDELETTGADEPEATDTEETEIGAQATDEAADVYTYEIKLGSFSKMDSQRYVSIGDGNVYLVSNDPLDLYDAVLSDMIDHDETPSFENITGIQFAGTENYSLIYEEESANTYCSSDVYFAQLNGKSLPLDTYRVEDYAAVISLLNPTDYVNYKVTQDELVNYGLDEPELTVTVDYSYEGEDEETLSDTFVIHVGRNQEAVKAAEEAAAKAAEEEDADFEQEEVPAYVRIGDSPIIYEITASQYESLMTAAYDDLRHREVLTADLEDVYQVDITLEGVDYTLTSAVSEEDEDEVIWSYLEDELEITGFRSALDDLSADSFSSEKPSQKEEISLTVYLNNENHPQVSIELYRYDGSLCLAVVDGEPVSLVPRSQVVDLIEAVNAIVLGQ